MWTRTLILPHQPSLEHGKQSDHAGQGEAVEEDEAEDAAFAVGLPGGHGGDDDAKWDCPPVRRPAETTTSVAQKRGACDVPPYIVADRAVRAR